MGGKRKQITICSQSEAFNGALRLLLDGYEVHVTDVSSDVPADSDLLVWRVDGAVPVEQLVEVSSTIPTLVLADEEDLLKAVDAGCQGFLPSSASLKEIRDAVQTVVDGGAVVPPDLLGTLLHHLVERRRRDQSRLSGLRELTEREREVFRLAAAGLRKEDIGDRLYISPATARTHLQRVYRKLGVHSQSELMALTMHIDDYEAEGER